MTEHPTIKQSTHTSSNLSPNAGESFNVVSSLTLDNNGHIRKMNGLKITLPTPTAESVGADASGTAETKISEHNTSTEAHSDIRSKINELSAPSKVTEQNNNDTMAFWVGTKSEYDAITDRNPNCLYFTTDTAGDFVTSPSTTAACQHKVEIVTLKKNNWSNTDNTQQVSVQNVSGDEETQLVSIQPKSTRDNITNVLSYNVICIESAEGCLTFEAERIPDVDLVFIVETYPIITVQQALLTMTIINTRDNSTVECYYEPNMSWSDWVGSSYNTIKAKVNTASLQVNVNSYLLAYDEAILTPVYGADLVGSVDNKYYHSPGGAGEPE